MIYNDVNTNNILNSLYIRIIRKLFMIGYPTRYHLMSSISPIGPQFLLSIMRVQPQNKVSWIPTTGSTEIRTHKSKQRGTNQQQFNTQQHTNQSTRFKKATSDWGGTSKSEGTNRGNMEQKSASTVSVTVNQTSKPNQYQHKHPSRKIPAPGLRPPPHWYQWYQCTRVIPNLAIQPSTQTEAETKSQENHKDQASTITTLYQNQRKSTRHDGQQEITKFTEQTSKHTRGEGIRVFTSNKGSTGAVGEGAGLQRSRGKGDKRWGSGWGTESGWDRVRERDSSHKREAGRGIGGEDKREGKGRLIVREIKRT
jgi:hypothetical protein